MLTLRQAVDKVLRRVSLAGGPGTQLYAEDLIKEIIQHKFDVLFDDTWWPQFFNPGESAIAKNGDISGIFQCFSCWQQASSPQRKNGLP